MFPLLRSRAARAIDIAIEFATLGEYRLADPLAPAGPAVQASRTEPAPRHLGAPARAAAGNVQTGRARRRAEVGGIATSAGPRRAAGVAGIATSAGPRRAAGVAGIASSAGPRRAAAGGTAAAARPRRVMPATAAARALAAAPRVVPAPAVRSRGPAEAVRPAGGRRDGDVVVPVAACGSPRR
ncbi:MAG TPA: hypothetical protein VF520_02770 [Thermoleophilaceae bacterium]|jgi:hypothetical protein